MGDCTQPSPSGRVPVGSEGEDARAGARVPTAPPRTTSPELGPREEAQPEPPLTHIRPHRRWVPLSLGEVWKHRELAYFLIWRHVKTEHRQMALGPFWLVLRPILSVAIYTLIFGRLAKLPSDEVPYPLFAYTAVVLWTYFTGSVQEAATSLVKHQALLSKVYFPRLIVPLVGAAVGLIPLLFSGMCLVVLAFSYGYSPSWGLLLAPLYVSLAGLLAVAVGIWFAPWIAHYRDVMSLLDYGLLAWMYATPVVYSIQVVPTDYQALYRLNPMTVAVQGFRWTVLGVGNPPDWDLAVGLAFIIPMLVLGAYHFRRYERSVVDHL